MQRFVNTLDNEGPELLPDAAALRDWLVAAGLLDPAAPVEPDDHRRAIELREAIRALAEVHAGAPEDPAATATVDATARRAGLHPSWERRRAWSRPRRASTPRSAASSPRSTPRSPRAPGRA